ncbi:MAG: large subunit ribosomal protein L24 [Patiriisocius sp.]|jgi:large subunit ribosomal protein L24
MKIKKGDNVIVNAGKDKGKTGTVEQAFPKTDQVLVEGVNVKTYHQKNSRTRTPGQIIEKNAPIHVSNVSFLEGKKPVRIGYIVETDGDKSKKVRISRASGKKI